MKYSINVLLTIVLGSYGFCIAVPSVYERAEDYRIVNAILKISNLTQNEVDKFKLVALGKFQEPVAAMAGTYAVYKTGSQVYGLGSKVEGTTKGTFLEPYLAEGILSLLTDKKFWVIAGAAGVGYGAYKVLYPRLEKGILDQVKTFVDMCESLDVCNYYFGGENPMPLSSMGTFTIRLDGTKYNPSILVVNRAWMNASGIARQKGIENLLFQASFANQLLSQVEQTSEVTSLGTRINNVNKALNLNKPVIDYFAEQEMRVRVSYYSAKIQGAEGAARLDLTRQQASAVWYGKISLAATALSNFWDKSLRTLVYINDKKAEIAGGMATAIVLPILAAKALQTWYYSQ